LILVSVRAVRIASVGEDGHSAFKHSQIQFSSINPRMMANDKSRLTRPHISPAGLTQVSGEVATGSQHTTFDAMNLL
jgi:hypothetical protein